jgi:hypothetical protein
MSNLNPAVGQLKLSFAWSLCDLGVFAVVRLQIHSPPDAENAEVAQIYFQAATRNENSFGGFAAS